MTATAELADEQIKVCTECGREVRHLKKKKCGTCYVRERRGGTARRRVTLDPEIAALLLPMPGTRPSFAERVFTYVDAFGDCWEWTGATKDGYGVVGRGGRAAGNEQTHRAVWQMLVGPIPEGLELDHLCRNHSCCNPDHLEPVTPAVNKARGFGISILYSKRETCAFGHPLDGRTRDSKSGKQIRYCKTCKREKIRLAYIPRPRPPRTHCNSGKHPWIEENIYVHPKTGRSTCKPCKIDRQREAREAA